MRCARLPIAIMMLMTAVVAFADGDADPLSRWVEIDGIRVHYLEVGEESPDGALLLMVHGYCGSCEDYRPLMCAFPEGTHCVAMDLPGCGLSEKPDSDYDLPFFMGFLRSFSAAVCGERFVLVGHSMGGQLAVHFTSLWPESVERLVLISPYGLRGEEGGWLPLAQSGSLVDIALSLNNRLFIEWAIAANNLYKPRPETLRAVAESTAQGILGKDGVRSTARITRNLIGRDPVDEILPTIRAPTLILWGDHDALLDPKWGATFLSALPDARLAVIRDTGHMSMLERPQEAAESITGFLSP